MKLSMLRLLSISTLLISSLLANATTDKLVTDFQTKRIGSNPQIELKSLSIFLKQELPNGWYGYVYNVKATIEGKDIEVKDTLFSDGTLVTMELIDINNGRSLKDSLSPTMPKEYYSDKHFVAGNKNAKHKVVVFSDPLCAFCVDYVPEVINKAKENPQLIALYYYHFPLLRIHPAADVVTRAMIVAKNLGVKEVESKIYNGNLLETTDTQEENVETILENINKILHTKITKKQIDNPKVISQLQKDMEMSEDMMIQGTPTLFVDGKLDRTRRVFEGLK